MPLPLIAGAVAGGLAGLANIFSQNSANETNERIADKANEANQNSAREQMRFQERMSNTQYERGTADMKKAGINPMLAFSQGGASAPSGASASNTAARVESTRAGDAISSTINSASDAMRLNQELKTAELTNDQQLAQTMSTVAGAKNTEADTYNKMIAGEVAQAHMPGDKAEGRLKKLQADWDISALKYDNILKRISTGAAAASSAANAVGSITGPGKLGKALKGAYDRNSSKAESRTEYENRMLQRKLDHYHRNKK